MDEILTRIWNDFVARSTGPMWFRLILQPLVAAVFGVRAGLRNAKRGKSEEHRARVTDPAYRKMMLRQTWSDVGKMLIVGFALDAVFQFIALRTFYPGEALLVAFLLVAVPYAILRAVVGRFGSRG